MLIPNSLVAAIGLLSAALSTAHALGCYSRGPTWNDWNKDDQNPGLDSIADRICARVASTNADRPYIDYQAGGAEIACFGSWFFKYSIAIVVRNNRQAPLRLTFDECLTAVKTEMGGCSHGSEQNHAGFWYRLDPNDGIC